MFKIIKFKVIKQASALYGAMLISLLLGFVVSIINTRLLSIEDYGKLKFIQQLFAMSATFVAFGFSYSAARLVAHSNDPIHDDIIGSTVFIYGGISFFCMCGIFAISFIIDEKFNSHISYHIRLLSPLVFVSVFTPVIENLFQGTNRIYSLSLFRITPQFLYIIGCLSLILCSLKFTLTIALLLNFGLAGVVIIWMVHGLSPKFDNVGQFVGDIWQENKINGIHVYTGSIASVATSQLIIILLAYYYDMKSVSYYSLALVLSSPVQLIPSVMGTTLFRSFSQKNSIPLQTILATILPTTASLLIFWFIIENFLKIIYSEIYLPVVPLAKILSIGMAFHGLGDFFNRFLGAHGRGKELRNAAISSGVINTAGCLLLLPHYGAMGGSSVKTLSSVLYFSVIILYYIKNNVKN